MANGTLRDCDDNAVPDVCDISNGAEDKNQNSVLDTCEIARGDFNLDGAVNAADLSTLLNFWGTLNPPIGDLNGDGAINASDLALLLNEWGTPP